MCSPTTALGMQGAGAASSAVGAYYSAKGQKIAANSQAALDDINARMSEMSAQSALVAGQRAEQGSRLRTAQLKGSQKASLAANGIDVSAIDRNSTVTNILSTTDTFGEIDANTIAANAIAQAWGYRTEGTNYKNQALQARAGAKAINPFMAAGTSLLTSASAIAMNKYALDKSGAFGKQIIWDERP